MKLVTLTYMTALLRLLFYAAKIARSKWNFKDSERSCLQIALESKNLFSITFFIVRRKSLNSL
jgi:hypothetical protein